MAILNYTTTIDPFKTVSEIERTLVRHKAKPVMKQYEGESIVGLSFLIDAGQQQIPVRLPVKIQECLKVLQKEKKSSPSHESPCRNTGRFFVCAHHGRNLKG